MFQIQSTKNLLWIWRWYTFCCYQSPCMWVKHLFCKTFHCFVICANTSHANKEIVSWICAVWIRGANESTVNIKTNNNIKNINIDYIHANIIACIFRCRESPLLRLKYLFTVHDKKYFLQKSVNSSLKSPYRQEF